MAPRGKAGNGSPPTIRPENQVADWRKEMEADAVAATGMEANAGGGQFFSFRNGVISFNDMPIPGNQMAVIVLDSILENTYYTTAFEANKPAVPKCFAFGRDEPTMKPHPDVFEAKQEEHPTCAGCPQNVFGSGNGRAKACSNRRRLSLLSAGIIDKDGRFQLYDETHFNNAPIGLLRLPPTSIKSYASYVKKIGGVYDKPPYAVATLIKMGPGIGNSPYTIITDLIGELPDELIPLMQKRRRETKAQLEQPYQLTLDDAPPAPNVTSLRGRRAKY